MGTLFLPGPRAAESSTSNGNSSKWIQKNVRQGFRDRPVGDQCPRERGTTGETQTNPPADAEPEAELEAGWGWCIILSKKSTVGHKNVPSVPLWELLCHTNYAFIYFMCKLCLPSWHVNRFFHLDGKLLAMMEELDLRTLNGITCQDTTLCPQRADFLLWS